MGVCLLCAHEWFEAARDGDEKSIAEKLNESTTYLWHREMITEQIAFHIAVENGHENVVAQLLAVDPSFVDAVDPRNEGQIALHIAAARGHCNVLELLLAAKPSSVTTTIEGSRQSALHCAARGGHKTIVDKLLAVCPALIDVVAFGGRTVLHEAASCTEDDGRTIVARLLAEKPSLIDVTDEKGNLALHFAVLEGCSQTVAELMAALPGSASTANKSLHIPLHFAATHVSERMITQLLQANPEGAFALDKEKKTPFQIAVKCHNSVMVDMLQHRFSYDELTQMFKQDSWVDQLEQLQCELAALCESALRDALYPDLIDIVREYIVNNNGPDTDDDSDASDAGSDSDTSRDSGCDNDSERWAMKLYFVRKASTRGSIDLTPPKPEKEQPLFKKLKKGYLKGANILRKSN